MYARTHTHAHIYTLTCCFVKLTLDGAAAAWGTRSPLQISTEMTFKSVLEVTLFSWFTKNKQRKNKIFLRTNRSAMTALGLHLPISPPPPPLLLCFFPGKWAAGGRLTQIESRNLPPAFTIQSIYFGEGRIRDLKDKWSPELQSHVIALCVRVRKTNPNEERAAEDQPRKSGENLIQEIPSWMVW